MPEIAAPAFDDVDSAFDRWEQLRRKMVEREQAWADTRVVLGDPQRHSGLRSEWAQLKQAADEAFERALSALDAAGMRLAGRPEAR